MIRQESAEIWLQAAQVIEQGGLVVFPTDTVYGVGCDPYNVAAIERVYEAKSRSHMKALPLLLSDVSVLRQVTRISQETNKHLEALGRSFWPGALTVVVAKALDLPDELGSSRTIAVRVPNHTGLRGFIRSCGGAIAATSANLSGEPDALDAVHAEAYLGRWVEIVVDGGRVRGGVASTVVDCTGRAPVILRSGPISLDSINRVLEAYES